MQMRTGVYWSVGVGGGKNQDSLSLQHVSLQRGECLLAAVCDGIGSLVRCEEAGGFVVCRMTDWFYHEGRELIYQNSAKELILFSLQRQLCQIQEHLKHFQFTEQIQTGTTFTGILLIKDRYYLMHIGDSRIYRIRKKTIPLIKQKYSIQCMTQDDKNEKGYLLKCLGMAGEDRVFLDTGKLKKHTCLLLATDGFYHGSFEKRAGQSLGPLLSGSCKKRGERGANSGEEALDRRLELLGEMAVREGSRDNMAAIAILVV